MSGITPDGQLNSGGIVLVFRHREPRVRLGALQIPQRCHNLRDAPQRVIPGGVRVKVGTGTVVVDIAPVVEEIGLVSSDWPALVVVLGAAGHRPTGVGSRFSRRTA